MTALRWIMLVLTGLAAFATVGSFGVFIGTGIDVWGDRAKVCRRWFYAAALLWFNSEVWGRVLSVLIHWN